MKFVGQTHLSINVLIGFLSCDFYAATCVWEQLTFPKNQQPPERHSMSFAVYNDKWYMFGGIGPNGQRSNELFSFDFSASWLVDFKFFWYV